MGFWSTIGSVANAVGNQSSKYFEKVEQLKSEYQSEGDTYLAKKAFSSNSQEKMAALSVLKDRGYDNDSIRKLYMDNK